MKKLNIIHVILVWGLSLSANAKDITLFLGEDLPLCQHMFEIYKKDFKEYGHVNFNEHKEFNNIGWASVDSKKVNMKYGKSHSCAYFEKSEFDINNDNRNEYVIRNSACISDVISSKITVYDLDEVNSTNNSDLSGVVAKYELKLWGWMYYLKRLPKVKLRGQFEGKEVYPSIAGTALIEPFRYKDKTYISILGTPGSHIKNEWITVSELTKDYLMQDICYFKNIVT